MLNLSIHELGEMTPREFQNKLSGFNKQKEQDMFFQRHLAWLQLKSWGAKIKPENVYPLHVDERIGTTKDIPTIEESRAVIREFKKVNPKLFRPSGR